MSTKAGIKFRGPRVAAVPSAQARRQILETVRRIPRGCVASYGQVAFDAGLPGRARLVGRILSECTDAKLCWHRVINAQGEISLPKSTPAHAEQKRRLREEGVVFSGGRVNLRRYAWRPRSEAPLLD